MAYEFDGHNEEHDAENGKGEPSSPCVLPDIPASDTDTHNREKYENRAKTLLKPAYEWMRFKAWPSVKLVIFSSSFWTAAATVAIAIATIGYTRYAKKQWE